MKNTQYIQIQGWMVNELKLKGNDLIVYAIIFGFSQDGESKYNGSLDYLGESINASRPTVIKSLKHLTEIGLINKKKITLKNRHYCEYMVEMSRVNNLHLQSKETLPSPSKETLPNININNTIDNRKENFKNSLSPFLDKYGKNLLNEFYGYWTEHGEKDKKMRFEKQPSFGISRRLATWAKRDYSNNTGSQTSNVEAYNEETYKN